MANGVVWWEIAGKDGARLQQFYANAFDWQVNADNPMQYGLVDGRDGGIGGGLSGTQPGMDGHVRIYVAVDDLDAHLKKIEGLGGKTVMPPMEIPGMVTFALFADPEGNTVGLIKNM